MSTEDWIEDRFCRQEEEDDEEEEERQGDQGEAIYRE
jgi:hypothetical protein